MKTFTLHIAVALALTFAAGCGSHKQDHQIPDTATEGVVYACPMLCVPPSPTPGDCPVCGMHLEAVANTASGKDATIALSERSRALIGIEEAPVERRAVSANVRISGTIVPDETRVATVTARVDGRIEKLSADFTGARIETGSPLLSIYSPELLSAQEELIQGSRLKNASLAQAAREKLRLLGITPDQIENIAKADVAGDFMTISAPISGTIIEKAVSEGSYVKTGDRMYTIADLSHVWAKLDVYESDLALIQMGQPVTLTSASAPGLSTRGQVSFVDPVLDARTHTAGVRVDLANEDETLKPGMIVYASVEVPLGADGKPLSVGATATRPLVIPATAPLITGERAVVYVRTDDAGEYAGREVQLGRRAGDDYVVLEGLSEGDRVVVNGNFKIDSALQIMGRPSMMQPEINTPEPEGEIEELGADKGKPQTICPIMGNAISRDVFLDHKGYRVYFCCPGCDSAFEKDPDRHIIKMQQGGVTLDRTPPE
jgi:membrane fusion protein, copper/silver efflux system